ncbi:hypothetical protein AMAG_09140 [Allomyces macrogynus ATCC 38327]|uniref:STI1 domain-containing protein n=1 Tax=Allomyces macrogynus (strain ATCC 38327) TaxID=578462 RepID=A0A0L0SNK7_ALLM3|nr:hypothetical protein AMAG_09140 [Allomyces macrogynus ATCC 38327]|eukprot:KNE64082.1 hypothetical protein AMAG_09140 [Allomyces macrogynus ATCC 38327]
MVRGAIVGAQPMPYWKRRCLPHTRSRSSWTLLPSLALASFALASFALTATSSALLAGQPAPSSSSPTARPVGRTAAPSTRRAPSLPQNAAAKMMGTGSSPHAAAASARTTNVRRHPPVPTAKSSNMTTSSASDRAEENGEENDDYDLPPLEDMSHELRRLREPLEAARRAAVPPANTATSSKSHNVPITRDSTSLTADLAPSNPFILGDRTAGTKPTTCDPAPATGASKAAPPKTTKSTTPPSSAPSLGMKRGFLNAAPKKTAAPCKPAGGKVAARKPAPIPVLAPKPNTTKDHPFMFKEVQDALNASQGLLDKKEWLTPDLLAGIDQDPSLASTFDDPEFGRVLTAMQRDPAATMNAYRTHPRAQQFMAAMQKVTGMMGTQLDQLANRAPPPAAPTTAADLTEGLPEHERKIVDAVRKDPRLQDALRDPGVQQLMQDLRTRPGAVPRALQTQMSKDMLAKVQLLVEAGVLQLQS